MQLCQILLRKNAEDYDPKDLKRTMEPRLRQMHLKTIDKQAFLFFLWFMIRLNTESCINILFEEPTDLKHNLAIFIFHV